MTRRVLFVDDDAELRSILAEALRQRDFDIESCESTEQALSSLDGGQFDVVLTDVNLDGTSGIDLCRHIQENRPEIPVVVATGYGSMETAVQAIRAGAYDFVSKPLQIDDLALTLGRAIQLRTLKAEVRKLREQVDSSRSFDGIVGKSPVMQKVFELLGRIAESTATVLVTGESGTGKELIARALHDRSGRRDGPFVAINCAALPESILESELFGHVRGAFTDAKQAKQGLLVAAGGGTLFLDEIGDMPAATQVKLLRALQERTVRPVGGDQEVPFDARIIAATNRDLEADVTDHRFREDLYYRINVVRVHVPPLRARLNDVLLMAQAFVERYAAESGKGVKGVSVEAAEKLLAYDWPGNVRELQNCIERAVALTRFDQIMVDDLPDRIRRFRGAEISFPADNPAELISLDELERKYMLRVLRTVNGNKTLAAQVLGLDRRTLYRRLERYGEALSEPEKRSA